MPRAYDTPPPAALEEDDAPRPIGVGADYKPEFQGLTQDPAQTKVRYYGGDEREQVAGMSAEDRAELQLTLRDLGLIGPETRIRLGVWDDTSASAFRQVLAWANTRGIGWRAALVDMGNSAALGELGGSEREAPLPENSIDVQALGRESAREVLGRGLSDQEKAQFEQRFRSMEAPYLNDSATVKPPDPEEWARQQARAIDPVRADSRSAVKVAGVISRMMGGAMPSDQQTLEG